MDESSLHRDPDVLRELLEEYLDAHGYGAVQYVADCLKFNRQTVRRFRSRQNVSEAFLVKLDQFLSHPGAFREDGTQYGKTDHEHEGYVSQAVASELEALALIVRNRAIHLEYRIQKLSPFSKSYHDSLDQRVSALKKADQIQ